MSKAPISSDICLLVKMYVNVKIENKFKALKIIEELAKNIARCT
jgi:hypothetical protein